MSRLRQILVDALVLLGSALLVGHAAGADQALPFEGTWVRADRVCSPAAPSSRTYTARTLVSPSGRCTIRKVAYGTSEYEIFEDCRRPERAGNVVEKIRMLGTDAMVLKYQVNRLKIPRGRRYVRCTVAAVQKPAATAPGPGRSLSPPMPKAAVTPPQSNHDPE